MYDLIVRSDSCLFASSYMDLESRVGGQFGTKAVYTRSLVKMDQYSSFLKINIKDLRYMLEILRHKDNKNDFQIRIFKEDKFILGRHYKINEDISLTRVFKCILTDIHEQLEKCNEKTLNCIQENSIIELIFKHLWETS